MFGKLLRTLGSRARSERTAWAKQNALRPKYESGALAVAFAHLCAYPIGWTIGLFALGFSASVFLAAFPPPYNGFINWLPKLGSADEPSAAELFLGLWAVQAALVAVVYPIVVAFVTILLQRAGASKASLHAYFSRSAARLTGVSSIGLMILMGLQFVAVSEVDPLSAYAWLLIDGLWGLANLLLTAKFLVSTFTFSTPEGRSRARFEYVLTGAWPSEWEHHVKFLFSRDPVGYGLIRATSAPNNLDGQDPAFSVGSHLAHFEAVHFKFRRERSVSEIRYLFVQWAFDLWRRGEPKAATGRGTWTRPGAVFEVALAYADRFSHEDAVVRTSSEQALGILHRVLLRAAFTLRTAPVEPPVTIRDVLEELRVDAAAAAQADSESEFLRQCNALVAIITGVVEASGCSWRGARNNWVLLLSSGESIAESSLLVDWMRVLRDLHATGISKIPARSNFVKATLSLPKVLLVTQRPVLTAGLREAYVLWQYIFLFDLLGWGADAAAGGEARADGAGRVVGASLRDRYDQILREAIGTWETLKSYYLIDLKELDGERWAAVQSSAKVLSDHLANTARLVLAAARGDDRAAIEYFTDSLLRWADRLDFGARDGAVDYPDEPYLSLSHLSLDWTALREAFPPPFYSVHDREDSAQEGMRSLALENLWRDVAFIVSASVSTQATSGDVSRGVAALVVRSLIDGVPLLRNEDAARYERPFLDATSILRSLFRQWLRDPRATVQYRDHVDELAEAIGTDRLARGIPGRGYSFTGTSLDQIRDIELVLLARQADADWDPATEFPISSSHWPDERVRDLLQKIEQWIAALQGPDLADRFQWLWALCPPQTGGTLLDHCAIARVGLERLRDRLQNVRTEELRSARISAVAIGRLSEALAQVVGTKPRQIPLAWLNEPIGVTTDSAGAVSRSFRVSEYDKALLVEPAQSTRPVNEVAMFQGMVLDRIAAEALRGLTERKSADVNVVAGKDDWIRVLRTWGRHCRSLGLTPVAVVPRRGDPPWLVELRRPTTTESVSPVIQRRSDFRDDESYLGHLDDVPIFVGPVRLASTLLATREEFYRVELLSERGEIFSVTAEEEESKLKCILTVQWKQVLQGGPGPVAIIQVKSVAG